MNRTRVTFRTRALSVAESSDDRLPGEDAARWLIEALPRHGVAVEPEPGQEDWGWTVFAEHDGAEFWLGVGPMQEDDDPRTWLVFVEHSGIIQRFTKRGRAALNGRLSAVSAALRSRADFSEVQWHTKDDFNRGRTENSADRP